MSISVLFLWRTLTNTIYHECRRGVVLYLPFSIPDKKHTWFPSLQFLLPIVEALDPPLEANCSLNPDLRHQVHSSWNPPF